MRCFHCVLFWELRDLSSSLAPQLTCCVDDGHVLASLMLPLRFYLFPEEMGLESMVPKDSESHEPFENLMKTRDPLPLSSTHAGINKHVPFQSVLGLDVHDQRRTRLKGLLTSGA